MEVAECRKIYALRAVTVFPLVMYIFADGLSKSMVRMDSSSDDEVTMRPTDALTATVILSP